MSTQRTEVRVIKARERVAFGVECAHCSRDSLIFTAAGLITWKAPHGDHVHENATSVQTLLRWGIETALDAATLKDLRRMIDEKLEAA